MTAETGPDTITIRPQGGKRLSLAAGCLSLFGVFVLALLGYIAWAGYLPPPQPENVVLPTPNGFDACVAAASRLSPLSAAPIADPEQVNLAELRRALAPQKPALDELRAALRLEYRTPPVRDSRASFAYLAPFREVARELRAESVLARAEGRRGEAMQRALDAVELGGKIGRGGVLIHHLVAYAILAIGHRTAEDCVEGLSAEEAREAGQRLDRILAGMPRLSDALAEDHKLSVITLRAMAGGKVPRLFDPGGGIPSLRDRAEDLAIRLFYPKVWSLQKLNRYYQSAIAEASKRYRARAPVSVPDDPYLPFLASPSQQTSLLAARAETSLLLLRLELALQEYRAHHGAYPQTLAELKPGTMAAVPLDPFGAVPPVYRRQGSGYLLYSLGPDGVDDGGMPLPSGAVLSGSRGDLVAGHLYSRTAGRGGAR